MNEEAKRSMVDWQEKLDKVTKDSEERIAELQQKLAKVRNATEDWFLLSDALFIYVGFSVNFLQLVQIHKQYVVMNYAALCLSGGDED